ncbi:hypothetical protein C8F04DRAFT_1182016 [Mycena alexandri]|uniref:Uncharacterized protein n=1 Tax=Mycena alexandri TaxID=1745969 RepID=A0AAD6SXR4_9AGAR|nr:hypothetical protein C8F04DRAFT_1182016 [Mycena alexandri]
MVLLIKLQARNLSDHYGAPDEVSGLQSSSLPTSNSDHYCAPDDEKPSRTTMVLLTKFQASNPLLNPNNLQLTSNVCLMVLLEIIQIGLFPQCSTPIKSRIYWESSLSDPAAVYSTTWTLKFKIQVHNSTGVQPGQSLQESIGLQKFKSAELFDLGKIAQEWTDFVGRDANRVTRCANRSNFIISSLEPDDNGGVCGEVWRGESAWAAGGGRRWSRRGWRRMLLGCISSCPIFFLHFGLRQLTNTTLGLPHPAGLPPLLRPAAQPQRRRNQARALDTDLEDGGHANSYADPSAPTPTRTPPHHTPPPAARAGGFLFCRFRFSSGRGRVETRRKCRRGVTFKKGITSSRR